MWMQIKQNLRVLNQKDSSFWFKTRKFCFICIVYGGRPLKLNHFTHLSGNISSTESNVNIEGINCYQQIIDCELTNLTVII